jgi:predicted AlkP superfamily pyrophosphatase or phosphodiesterase
MPTPLLKTIVAITLALCASTTRANHVVLITIDGMAADMLDDPQASLPTLRSLAKAGATAKGMRPINPSVTWPNHTTLITGVRADKHSCFFNGLLERPGVGKAVIVQGNHDQAALVAVPTLFDHLHKLGQRTAAINWPCTRGSASVHDNFPDVPDAVKHTTPRLRDQLIADGWLTDDTNASFVKQGIVRRDEIWTAAACRAIRDSKPSLLALHLLTTDGVHHTYGPRTTPGYAALAVADLRVRQVLDALDAAGIREQTTVLVVADHGFAKATKLIYPNVAFRQAGLLTAGLTTVAAARAQAIPEGGTALVYLTDPATIDDDRRKVTEMMKSTEGVADVIAPDRYADLGFPPPAKNSQSPDLVLVPKDGYAFAGVATGADVVADVVMGRHTVGHHGYLNTNPQMNAVFIASGRNVRAGAKLDVIDNVDVAPTIAKFLDLELRDVDGKPITDLLR